MHYYAVILLIAPFTCLQGHSPRTCLQFSAFLSLCVVELTFKLSLIFLSVLVRGFLHAYIRYLTPRLAFVCLSSPADSIRFHQLANHCNKLFAVLSRENVAFRIYAHSFWLRDGAKVWELTVYGSCMKSISASPQLFRCVAVESAPKGLRLGVKSLGFLLQMLTNTGCLAAIETSLEYAPYALRKLKPCVFTSGL